MEETRWEPLEAAEEVVVQGLPEAEVEEEPQVHCFDLVELGVSASFSPR